MPRADIDANTCTRASADTGQGHAQAKPIPREKINTKHHRRMQNEILELRARQLQDATIEIDAQIEPMK